MKRAMLILSASLLALNASAHGEHDYDWMQEAPPPEVTDKECAALEKQLESPEKTKLNAAQSKLKAACDETRQDRYKQEM